MKKLLYSLTGLLIILPLVNCSNPLPTLNSLSPSEKVSHLPTFTLTVIGSDFSSDSKIVFNGAEKPTVYSSSTELSCEINPTDIATGPMTIPVLVHTPSPSGGDSNSLDFMVKNNFTFDTPRNLSNTFNDESRYPSICIDSSDTINCVWFQTPESAYHINCDTFFIRSDDGGNTWAPIMNISNTSKAHYWPKLTVDPTGKLYCAWRDTSPGYTDIFFSASINNGSSWSASQNISNSTGDKYRTDLSADNSGVYVVWMKNVATGNDEIFFRRSLDGGSSWEAIMNLSNTSNYSMYPAIVVDSGGGLNCVWSEKISQNIYTIHFIRSTDMGLSWSAPTIISSASRFSSTPSIAVDDANGIYVAWQDWEDLGNLGPSTQILFSRSLDSGSNWSTPLNLSNSPAPGYCMNPVIAVDSAGNINCVWEESLSIYFCRSIDAGSNWTAKITLPPSPYSLNNPDMAADSLGNIHIVWTDQTPYSVEYDRRSEIYYCTNIR